MLIEKKLLLNDYGKEQGYLLKDGEKLSCEKCGFQSFHYVEDPKCVSCNHPLGVKIEESNNSVDRELREKKKEALIDMLIDDPLKHASDFVEVFIQSDEAKHLLRDAGFGRTGMSIVETSREVLKEIRRKIN